MSKKIYRFSIIEKKDGDTVVILERRKSVYTRGYTVKSINYPYSELFTINVSIYGFGGKKIFSPWFTDITQIISFGVWCGYFTEDCEVSKNDILSLVDRYKNSILNGEIYNFQRPVLI